MLFIIVVFHYGAIRQYIWCEYSGIKLDWYETLKVAVRVSEWMSGSCTLTVWFTVHVCSGQDTLWSFCIILITDWCLKYIWYDVQRGLLFVDNKHWHTCFNNQSNFFLQIVYIKYSAASLSLSPGAPLLGKSGWSISMKAVQLFERRMKGYIYAKSRNTW